MTIRASCVLDETEQEKEMKEFHLLLANSEGAVSFCKSGNLVLEVVDTGAGMTPGQVSTMFRDGIQFNVNDLVSLWCLLSVSKRN